MKTSPGQRGVNRWTAAALLGTACAAFVFWAFPRYDSAARLGFTLDRDGYIERGRAFARAHGTDVAGAKGYAMADHERDAQLFRIENPNDPLARVLAPAKAAVAFALHGNKSASVTFASDGQPNDWKLPVAPAARPGEEAGIARQALDQLAADAAPSFQPTMAPRAVRDGNEYAWQRNEASGARLRITAVVKNGYVRQASKDFTAPDAFSKTHDKFPVWRAVPVVIWWVALFGCIFPIRRGGAADLVRGMKERSVLILSVCFGLIGGVTSLLEIGDASDVIAGNSGGPGEMILGTILGSVVLAVLCFMLLASLVANVRPHVRRARGLRLAGTADVFTRSVAAEALGGVLASPLLIAIPLVIAAALKTYVFNIPSDSLILNPAAAVYAFASAFGQQTLGILALFGCMIPMALRLPRHSMKLATAILFAIATAAALESPFSASVPGDWLAWGATGAALLWIYGSFGVLGAFSAYVASRIVNNAGVLITQPASGIHASGIATFVVAAAFAAVALFVAIRGRESDRRLSGEASGSEFVRSRREELLAEFHVARSAQQQMLPSQPPALKGYTLSASCDPAREVGGDLYDFVRLKDGRWAIGVADVSGKGVPAALYMTLTKGLLRAASEDAEDPRSILAAVNTHLREVAKKKMFVTMALGALDPESGSVDYVRAGHNPIVWRRAAINETKLLKPAGIGLGIATPALFSKTLAIERIELEPGDALVFYSDGLTEAMDASLEQFGEDRLMAAVSASDGLDAAATRDTILRTVNDFLRGGHSQDDLTVAVLRAGSNGNPGGR